jgi:hypothetical protein
MFSYSFLLIIAQAYVIQKRGNIACEISKEKGDCRRKSSNVNANYKKLELDQPERSQSLKEIDRPEHPLAQTKIQNSLDDIDWEKSVKVYSNHLPNSFEELVANVYSYEDLNKDSSAQDLIKEKQKGEKSLVITDVPITKSQNFKGKDGGNNFPPETPNFDKAPGEILQKMNTAEFAENDSSSDLVYKDHGQHFEVEFGNLIKEIEKREKSKKSKKIQETKTNKF